MMRMMKICQKIRLVRWIPMNDLSFNDYKFKIIDNIDDEDLLNMFDSNNVVYVKPGVYAMSTRKLEALIKISYIQK